MILDCPHCDAAVATEQIGWYPYLPRGDGRPGGRFLFARCVKSEHPILIVQENIGNQVEGDKWDTPVLLFPPDEAALSTDIPAPIRRAYEEAAACFRARAFTAAAVMCRKTLEGVCAAHNVQERGLLPSLKRMRAEGLIDDRLYEWADQLRIVGNEAVHDVDVTVSRDDSRDTLDFARAILEYLFAYRMKFERFKQRRGK